VNETDLEVQRSAVKVDNALILPEREREREIYFESHISWWEHSSLFRLIGRGVPNVLFLS